MSERRGRDDGGSLVELESFGSVSKSSTLRSTGTQLRQRHPFGQDDTKTQMLDEVRAYLQSYFTGTLTKAITLISSLSWNFHMRLFCPRPRSNLISSLKSPDKVLRTAMSPANS